MSDRETQIREMARVVDEHAWEGSLKLAALLYAAGYRDFDAELRRRIDALPHANGEIEVPDVSDSDSVRTFSNHEIRCLRAALTAPEPAGAKPDGEQEPHCPKCGGPFCACVHPPREPTKPTPAPERRWVVQRKSDGLFRAWPHWREGAENGYLHDSEISALRWAASEHESCTVRAVVRQPGRRQFQQCPDAERTGGYWTIGQAGAGLPVRELPAPDGPWILEQP